MTMGCQTAVARRELTWSVLWDADGFNWLHLMRLYPRFMYSESCSWHRWLEHSPQCNHCLRHQGEVEALLQNECVCLDPSKYRVLLIGNEPEQFNSLKDTMHADRLKLCLCPPPMEYAGAHHLNFVVQIANIDHSSPVQKLILVRGVSMMLCTFRYDHALGMTRARRIYFGVSEEPSECLMNRFKQLQRKYTGIVARGVIAMGVLPYYLSKTLCSDSTTVTMLLE